MPHNLEVKYGLTATEMLDAIERRLRLRVALEGAVAEVHFERKLSIAQKDGWIQSFESHDQDGHHDNTILTLEGKEISIEVKTIRNSVRSQVELQKTRASQEDPTSRFYDHNQFDVVAVSIGRKTDDWADFRYAIVSKLPRHKNHPHKIQVMNSVPLDSCDNAIWFSKLKDLIDAL